MSKTPAPPAAAALLDDPKLARVLALLDGEGEETRLVGGAVRNALVGRPVREHDLATTALPEITMARAAAAGIRSLPTGIAHGTVTLLVEGTSFEVTTLREDVETDGRHAKVRFGRDFARDAARRDFTINALSLRRDGILFDYVGGLDDLEARKVRFIGDPRQRVREDFLRILRFFRFTADYGEGPIDAEGLSAAITEREGLARLSAERIHTELFKLFFARRAAEISAEVTYTGILGPLLQAAPDPERLAKLIARRGNDADALLRLAALALRVPEDAERLRVRLRLSNAEHQHLTRVGSAAVSLYGAEAPPSLEALKALLFTHGRHAVLDALALAEADAQTFDPNGWAFARDFLRDAEMPRLPFSGNDLMARGIGNGRVVGEALKALQALWIRAGFPKDPHRLATLLDEVAQGRKGH